MSFEIDICNRQKKFAVDTSAIRKAVAAALAAEQVAAAVLSISIVDDDEIHVMNRDHLDHDYPTDVISFQLDLRDAEELSDTDGHADEDADVNAQEPWQDEPAEQAGQSLAAELRARGARIEGEIIASVETANRLASSGLWSPTDELNLYVVHGLLHICGYDDLTPEEKRIMRRREQAVFATLGRTVVHHSGDAEREVRS